MGRWIQSGHIKPQFKADVWPDFRLSLSFWDTPMDNPLFKITWHCQNCDHYSQIVQSSLTLFNTFLRPILHMIVCPILRISYMSSFYQWLETVEWPLWRNCTCQRIMGHSTLQALLDQNSSKDSLRGTTHCTAPLRTTYLQGHTYFSVCIRTASRNTKGT